MTEIEIIEKLKKVKGAFDICQIISTFRFYRTDKDGNPQEVTLDILDAGPERQARYTCLAKTNDGKTALGNLETSIEYALTTVHWEELDWDI